ncbi:MAG: hypothetical protein EBZ77_07340 [Chitinophagia bacterium]|nr:hypothetical protein [Chitinophagia bacterium]
MATRKILINILLLLTSTAARAQQPHHWDIRLQADIVGTSGTGLFLRGNDPLTGKRGINPGFSIAGMLVHRKRCSIGLLVQDNVLALRSPGYRATPGYYTTVTGAHKSVEIAFIGVYGSLIRTYNKLTVEPYLLLGSGLVNRGASDNQLTYIHTKQAGSNYYEDEVVRPYGGSVRYTAGAGVCVARRFSNIFAVYAAGQYHTSMVMFSYQSTYSNINGASTKTENSFGQSLTLLSIKAGIQLTVQHAPKR